MQAIVGATIGGELAATACLAVSNRRNAPALEFARREGIRDLWIPTMPDPDAADARLDAALREAEADLVILSGYLRKLGPLTLRAFAGRVLNIHPALLPKYGGQGVYGRRVHEAVIAAGEMESDASPCIWSTTSTIMGRWWLRLACRSCRTTRPRISSAGSLPSSPRCFSRLCSGLRRANSRCRRPEPSPSV